MYFSKNHDALLVTIIIVVITAESDGPSVLEKFMLEEEGEDENGDPATSGDQGNTDTGVVELSLDSLISPKLIVNNN